MYKKSYTCFWLWMLGFIVMVLAIGLIPSEDWQLPGRLIVLLMSWGVTSMAYIIWQTEYVYWYNGTSFEEAEAAGSERRKAFAWKHLRIFGGYTLALTVFVCLMHAMGASAWIDFSVGTVGLVIAACMTIPIKL